MAMLTVCGPIRYLAVEVRAAFPISTIIIRIDIIPLFKPVQLQLVVHTFIDNRISFFVQRSSANRKAVIQPTENTLAPT